MKAAFTPHYFILRSQRPSLTMCMWVLLLLSFSARSVASSHSASIGSGLVDEKGMTDFGVSFVNIAGPAGLIRPVVYGGIDTKKYIIETNGCGVAFLDYDNDGWMDILLLNGTRLEGFPTGKEPGLMLYHNNRNGSFTEVTQQSGLSKTGWASAISVGDYDNDGFDDLFITYWGQNVLYRNNGNGTFTDQTAKAGFTTKERRWGSGCVFVDYDRDGYLDLFVANYLIFEPDKVPEPGKGANCL